MAKAALTGTLPMIADTGRPSMADRAPGRDARRPAAAAAASPPFRINPGQAWAGEAERPEAVGAAAVPSIGIDPLFVIPGKLHDDASVLPDLEDLEHFPGVQDASRIQGPLHRLHRAHLGG